MAYNSEYMKGYYQRNKAKISLEKKIYYLKNKEMLKKKCRDRYDNLLAEHKLLEKQLSDYKDAQKTLLESI